METGTLIRTIVLALALLNQTLVLSGYSPLPFDDAQVEQFITILFTTGASIWSWWKNNNITTEARWSQQKLNKYKAEKKYSKATGSYKQNDDIHGDTL